MKRTEHTTKKQYYRGLEQGCPLLPTHFDFALLAEEWKSKL